MRATPVAGEVRWSYIRYVGIPTDAGFDLDNDEYVDHNDYYYAPECLDKDGPGIFGGSENDAGRGVRGPIPTATSTWI